jgi:imidazolonepropionase-like amidohydrolase
MKTYKIFFIVGLLLACDTPEKKLDPTHILIQNVNIVDVRNGKILEKRQVVIDSGKIKSITETIDDPDSFSMRIDGKDKYLMPGLAEMHAHIPPPTTDSLRITETLFLYLSNGITTIRGMLGDPAHLVLREKAKNREILSPRIFTSSPSLNGTSVTTKEEAIEKVKAYKKAGYDFLKIHPGITLEVFDQIVQTANEVNMPFAGHVPVDVGIRHALESKYASIDHVDGFLEGLVPESQHVDPNVNGFFGYNFVPLADTTKINGLVAMDKKYKVWVVPTESLFNRWFAPVGSNILLQEPEMQYMPASTLKDWRKRKEEATGVKTTFNSVQWQQFHDIRQQLILKLEENGQGLLLGSDAPQVFNVPGFSIHHEMDGMLNAGLTPLQVLQSGTLNPATFFNMEDTFGEVKEGLDADLILLDDNPLQDLRAIKQISGVLVRGTWLSKKTIDDKLLEIAKNAAQN